MHPEPPVPSDLPSLKRLLAEADLPHEDLDGVVLADFLVLRGPDGNPLALVGLEVLQAEGLLRSLAVSPSLRGLGHGAALTAALEEHARRRGVRRLWLLTTTAEGFFARRGYRRTRRDSAPESVASTTEFASLCPSSAVCMTKDLEGHDGRS